MTIYADGFFCRLMHTWDNQAHQRKKNCSNRVKKYKQVVFNVNARRQIIFPLRRFAQPQKGEWKKIERNE